MRNNGFRILDQAPIIHVPRHDLIRVKIVRNGGYAQVGLQNVLRCGEDPCIKAKLPFAVHGLSRGIPTHAAGFLSSGIRVKRKDDPASER